MGGFTGSKLSLKYLVSCVPKNTLFMMSKNLSLFKGIFLYSGIMLFYFFNRYISYFIIILSILMSILFLKLFTEKNDDNFSILNGDNSIMDDSDVIEMNENNNNRLNNNSDVPIINYFNSIINK